MPGDVWYRKIAALCLPPHRGILSPSAASRANVAGGELVRRCGVGGWGSASSEGKSRSGRVTLASQARNAARAKHRCGGGRQRCIGIAAMRDISAGIMA